MVATYSLQLSQEGLWGGVCSKQTPGGRAKSQGLENPGGDEQRVHVHHPGLHRAMVLWGRHEGRAVPAAHGSTPHGGGIYFLSPHFGSHIVMPDRTRYPYVAASSASEHFHDQDILNHMLDHMLNIFNHCGTFTSLLWTVNENIVSDKGMGCIARRTLSGRRGSQGQEEGTVALDADGDLT
jgi:hypothetical protein